MLTIAVIAELQPHAWTEQPTAGRSSMRDQYAEYGCGQHRTEHDADRFKCVADGPAALLPAEEVERDEAGGATPGFSV